MQKMALAALLLLLLTNVQTALSSSAGAFAAVAEPPRRLRGAWAGVSKEEDEDEDEAAQADLQARLQVIDKAFADVTEHGDYISSLTPGQFINQSFENVTGQGKSIFQDTRKDVTWKMCTEINWTEVNRLPVEEKLDEPEVFEMVDKLYMGACSNESSYRNPTCAALRAAVHASIKMNSLFPSGPVFANHSVVAWGRYPSWVNGSVTNLSYDVMPPTATLQDPNGVTGYGLCDIIRTVLTQSPNQMQTGTCSYVAFLGLLSHKAPALMIKLAMRLFWTGRLSDSVGSACSPIYKQQPGLIPFLSKEGHWQPLFYNGAKESACSGNAIDCARGRDKPTQNAGLTSMWTQHMISIYVKENWGYCDENNARAGMMWPGQSKEEKSDASLYQGGTFSSMMWMCNRVIDPVGNSCKFHFNTNVCSFLDDEDCKSLVALQPDSQLVKQVLKPTVFRFLAEAFMYGHVSTRDQLKFAVARLEPTFEKYPMLRRYSTYVQQLAEDYDRSYAEILLMGAPAYPSFTSQMLDATCESHSNVLIIDATVLSFAMEAPMHAANLKANRLPFFGNFVNRKGKAFVRSEGCNHAVYLKTCDVENNNYVVWTWGTTVNLTREFILGWPVDQPSSSQATRAGYTWNSGSVCGSITADQITIA